MPTTKAQIRAVNKYMAKNYDNLRIVIPKGRKADVEAFAGSRGLSVNGLVNRLLMDAMQLSEDAWKAVKGDEE